MYLQKLNTMTFKISVSIAIVLLILLYSFYSQGDFILNLINNTFLFGIALILFSSSLAVYFSGSLNIFLAGFNKKLRSEMFDRLKMDDRKREKEENPDADINDNLIRQYEQEKEEKLKIRKSFFVRFPLVIGGSLVGFSFLLIYVTA